MRDIQVTEFEASIDKGKGWISKCLSKKYLNQRNHLWAPKKIASSVGLCESD